RSRAGRGAQAGDDRGGRPRRVRARARRHARPPDDGERRAAPPSRQRHARDPDRHGPARPREPQGVFRRRAAARPRGVSAENSTPVATPEYLRRTAGLLHDCLRDVIRTHQPEIEGVLAGERLDPQAPPALVARAIAAQGMWFQLLSIAEQNAAMRQRRQSEVERGYDQLRGTFAQVVTAAARDGIAADDVRAVVANLRVRPVITAHPTEAKRVSVLEKHRRIYRRLVDLEAPRWTPRERHALVENLRTEIELLWLTDELRLAKPTVRQELAWGVYFGNEDLFEVVPELVDTRGRADRRPAHARGRARGGTWRARGRAARPTGASGGGGIPLQHLPARHPRQLAARVRGRGRARAGPEPGRAACAGVARMARLAAG